LKLSVVMPTYNRAELVVRALLALADADPPGVEWEVIVVDDGSADETRATIGLVSLPVRYMRQENAGPAAARNLGLRESTGDLILFLGDDIIATKGLLTEHVNAHRRRPGEGVAVVGYTPLHPDVARSPLALWWEDRRFRFDRLLRGREPDFTYFYTCNVSVSRSILESVGGFDERFEAAAYEDTELAYRLRNQGLHVCFEPRAKAYHHHQVNLRSVCRQMYVTGEWYDTFTRLTGARGIPRLWQWLGSGPWMHPKVIGRLSRLAERLQTICVIEPLFAVVLMRHFEAGRAAAAGLTGDSLPVSAGTA